MRGVATTNGRCDVVNARGQYQVRRLNAGLLRDLYRCVLRNFINEGATNRRGFIMAYVLRDVRYFLGGHVGGDSLRKNHGVTTIRLASYLLLVIRVVSCDKFRATRTRFMELVRAYCQRVGDIIVTIRYRTLCFQATKVERPRGTNGLIRNFTYHVVAHLSRGLGTIVTNGVRRHHVSTTSGRHRRQQLRLTIYRGINGCITFGVISACRQFVHYPDRHLNYQGTSGRHTSRSQSMNGNGDVCLLRTGTYLEWDFVGGERGVFSVLAKDGFQRGTTRFTIGGSL